MSLLSRAIFNFSLLIFFLTWEGYKRESFDSVSSRVYYAYICLPEISHVAHMWSLIPPILFLSLLSLFFSIRLISCPFVIISTHSLICPTDAAPSFYLYLSFSPVHDYIAALCSSYKRDLRTVPRSRAKTVQSLLVKKKRKKR